MITIRPILGWQEWAGFPELGIPAVKARISTGEEQSFIYCSYLSVCKKKGSIWARFDIHPNPRSRNQPQHYEAKVVDLGRTEGHAQNPEHPVICTLIQVGNCTLRADVILIGNDNAHHCALLGGNVLKDRFFVDPGASFLMKKPASRP